MSYHYCPCGNMVAVLYNTQIRCAQCGAIYQHDPFHGGVFCTNVRIVTSNTTQVAVEKETPK